MIQEKELLSFIRSQRTWWIYLLSFFVPLGLFYLFFNFSGQIIQQQLNEGSQTKYKVAWVAEGTEARELKDLLELHTQIELTTDYEDIDLMDAIQNDSLDVAIRIEPGFDSSLVQQKQGTITLHYKSSGSGARVVESRIKAFKDRLKTQNLAKLQLSKNVIEPFYVNERNYFSLAEFTDNIFQIMQQAIASLLALLFLVFGSVASRHALHSVFWKEQEGGQLSWIAKTAIKKSILFRSKLLWATIFVWENMLLALLGFTLALSFEQEGPMNDILNKLRDLLPWTRILIFVLMSIPFAMLLLGAYSFLGFWMSAWRRLLYNSVFLLLIVGFLLMGAMPTMGWVGSLLPFFNQVSLAVAVLNGTAQVTTLLLVGGVSVFLGLALLLGAFLGFRSPAFLLLEKED